MIEKGLSSDLDHRLKFCNNAGVFSKCLGTCNTKGHEVIETIMIEKGRHNHITVNLPDDANKGNIHHVKSSPIQLYLPARFIEHSEYPHNHSRLIYNILKHLQIMLKTKLYKCIKKH